MTKNPKPATVKVEVPVQSTPKRAFLATIDGLGRDEQGRVIGANGIRWAV